VHINLNDAAPRIVITGEVTNAAGPYMVTLSKTISFDADNVFPPVSGAVVVISGPGGLTDTLAETTGGNYTTHNWQGLPGSTYSLFVLAEGQEYRATSTMPQPVAFDSLGFYREKTIGNKTHILALPYYQDPPGTGNYYQFVQLVNGVQDDRVHVYDDRLTDGKYSNRPLRGNDSLLQVGNNVTVYMYCIDKPVYDYFNTLDNITNINTFQSAAPANPITNLSNGALGYFSAHTISSKQAIVY
jgi:hypothetical protein